MTAGIPGVGIGGIFYLASALLMPMRSLAAVLGGRPEEARWPVALQQASLAGAILATLWVTGWVLGGVVTAFIPEATTSAGGESVPQVRNVVKAGALILSLGTLSLVLVLVQAVRLALPVRPTPSNPPAIQRVSARPAA